MPTDVTDPASVHALFAAIERRFGRLDLLFNNAGVHAPAVPMDELPLEKWFNVLNTNVTGVFLCARAAFGLMRAVAAGRTHHQQRLDLGAHAAALHGALHRQQARGDRPDQGARAGRPRLQHRCGQIDIGNAATEMTSA